MLNAICPDKQAAAALRESELRFRTLLGAVSAVTWCCPSSGLHIEPQPEWMAFTGQTAEEMLGDGWSRAVHPEDLDAAARSWRAAVARGEPYASEHRIRRHDGQWRWMSVRAAPIRDASGELVEWFGMNIDITEQKQAEAALRASERLFRAIFNQQFQYSVLLTPEGQIIEISDSIVRGTGVKAEEVIGKPFLDGPWWRELPEMRARWRRQFDEALARPGPSQAEAEYRTSDGEQRYALNTVTALRDEKGEVEFLLGEGVDITERKRVENALRESEERLRRVSNNAEVGLIRCSREGRYVSANPAYAKIVGKLLDEIVDRPIAEVIGEEAAANIRPYVDAALRGEHVAFEAKAQFPGVGQRHLHVSYTPDADDASQIVGWVACVSDITERKEAEVALREADRRKDELLAMLAHELRNPLAPIRNGLELLRKVGTNASPASDRLLLMMGRQVDHLVRLVDDLLDTSRINCGKFKLQRQRLDLVTLLDQAVDTSRRLFDAEGPDLRLTLSHTPLPVDGDPVRLTQVFVNLLSNAARHTKRDGSIDIIVERVADEAVVSVTDTGAGISKELLPHIFDLFVQGGENIGRSQQGLGIGLALVREIVQLHGGTVEAHSDGEGLGSRFVVRLPFMEGGDTADSAAAGIVSRAKASRRVMVVDDMPEVAGTLASLLEVLGATVRVAHSGAQGLVTCADFEPELVLLDIGMPEMDGFETARRIREMPAGRKAMLVALTGWGEEQTRARTKEAGFDRHLVKPIHIKQLEELLASACAESAQEGTAN